MEPRLRPIIDAGLAHQHASVAYAALREHDKSPAYHATLDWLDALLAQHQAYMVTCARERLGDAQVRLKQLIALRTALAKPGGAATGFVFD